MTPITIQKLFLTLSDFDLKSLDVVESKFRFCNQFEAEMGLSNSTYSEDIYDFIYNLLTLRRFIKLERYREIYSDFCSIDFKNFLIVRSYIEDIYNELILANREYFMKKLKAEPSARNILKARDIAIEIGGFA